MPDSIIDSLPAFNATFNGLSTLLLLTGFVLIRRKKYAAHGVTMSLAFAASSVFLIGYLLHKFYRPDIRLRERFPTLPIAWAYFYWFVVLIPHLILAVVMLPFIGLAFYRAYRREWAKHTRITRWLVWVWLYVSITGVLIYALLYHFFPAIGRSNG
ncbi:MAG: DUF420 domain-containing protein [Tepidisphaeraceae bacterium]